MLTKLTTLALALCASPALAQESFPLFAQGSWEVYYQTHKDGSAACVASVSARDLYFSFDVTRNAGVVAFFIDMNSNYGDGQEGKVDVWIDNEPTWVTPARGFEQTIMMVGLNRDFLVEVMSGRKLMIDTDRDGFSEVWFSLEGSNAAIQALADCSKKL